MKVNRNSEVSKQEIRNVSLDIFEKILDISKKLNIHVWVMYGTLIGAVRHKGFIPWDDDFDLVMKRDDYNKFVNYCITNKNELSPYYIDHYSCNKNYPFYISRICDPNYELEFDNLSYKSGIFIDLYPLDGMGNDISYWRDTHNVNFYTKKIRFFQDLIWYRNYKHSFIGDSFLKKLLHYSLGCYAKTRSNYYWFSKLDKIAATFDWDNSKFVAPVAWDTRVCAVQRCWFDKTVWLSFENIEVPVPSDYDKILKEIYGDYMQLPPVNKRKATHYYKAYKLVK